MVAGNEYEFRVTAFNKGGDSEPSQSSSPVLAKVRFIKPKINRDVFPTEKTVHSEQALKYDKLKKIYRHPILDYLSSTRIEAEIKAEPAPEITWTFPDGKSVLEAARDRASIEYEDGVATLIIKNITRADAGNYHIVAKNTQVSQEFMGLEYFPRTN